MNSDDILGGVVESAVVYVQGNPALVHETLAKAYATEPIALPITQGY